MRKKRRYFRGRKKKKKNLISNIILGISIIVFVVSSCMLVVSMLPYIQGKKEYKNIQNLAIKQNQKVKEKEETSFSVDFDELLKMNPDTVGWIRFNEPSVINYPVVQGRDNSQYLTQCFTADDNKLGTIFMDEKNNRNFQDRETIIYGHNMQYGGEMFTKLIEYESKEFYDKNPEFYIYTPDKTVSTYRIFAVDYVQDDSNIYSLDLVDDAAFLERIDEIKKQALYSTEGEIKAGDKIVVLSTCTNGAEDQRLIVCGVRIGKAPSWKG